MITGGSGWIQTYFHLTQTLDQTAPRHWNSLSRYEQIRHTVERHRFGRWLTVDDDGAEWGEEHRDNLVLTYPLLGLGASAAQRDLRETLERLHR